VDSKTDGLNEEKEKRGIIRKHRPWEAALACELWKHHASAGGADKDRMVQISTWLLGLSAAIIGFTLTKGIELSKLKEPIVAGLLAGVGLGISLVAALIVLIYGGYANWRWAEADQIADAYDWDYLLPTNSPFDTAKDRYKDESDNRNPLVGFALRRAEPRLPHKKLAPIFWIFFWGAVFSFLIHLFVLMWSIGCMYKCPNLIQYCLVAKAL